MAPVALVTGAASGIGRAVALRVAALGYRLVLIDKDHAGLQSVAAELVPHPEREHELVVADVTDAQAWEGLADTLSHDQADVALLVQAAGVLVAGRLLETEAADLQRQVEVNLTGALFGSRSIGPLLAASVENGPSPLPRGMLTVASVFGVVSPPGFAAYNASKAALVALSETLRGEWAPLGLIVTAALPGVTPTHLFRNATYTHERVRDQVTQRVAQVELTADSVADAALVAYRRGRVLAPIGRKAGWYFRLKRWFPEWLLRRVAAEANGFLDDPRG